MEYLEVSRPGEPPLTVATGVWAARLVGGHMPLEGPVLVEFTVANLVDNIGR